LNSFFKGFGNFFKAFEFVFKHGLFWVYLLPLFCWAILFVLGLYNFIEATDLWVESGFDKLLKNWNPKSANDFWEKAISWTIAGIRIIGKWLVRIMVILLLARILKYVILIITAPIIAWVSEKAEEIITGNSYPFRWSVFLRDSWRGILIALRNMFLELCCYLAGFIITLIFAPAGVVVAPVLFFISAYFMGFSMYDYMAERQKMNLSASVRWIRQNKNEVLGLGVAYNLISMIPVADMVIAPVNGCVGAVLNRMTGNLNSSGEKTF